jgi:predicted transcriptional regulator
MNIADDLTARIQHIAERAQQRQRERTPKPTPQPAPVVRLPLWPAELRTCPSCVLRSALFGVVQRGRRKALEGEILATWEGVTIRYTGWRLDQADLDVWLAALHLAREHHLGVRVSVTLNAMLRTIGRPTAGSSHEWLKGAIRRLTACAVEITRQRRTYWGSLIEKGCRDEETGEFVIVLNPELAVLFEDDDFTRLEWEIRRSLGMDLAKWLHGYIASHQATPRSPHRIGLERLQALCGSDYGRLRDFRDDLRKAMAQLQAAGVVTAWRLTPGDALEVVRPNRKRRLIEGENPTG